MTTLATIYLIVATNATVAAYSETRFADGMIAYDGSIPPRPAETNGVVNLLKYDEGEMWWDCVKDETSAPPDPPAMPTPRRWTPLAIKRAAAKLGKWQDLKAFLVAADAYDDFCMAQYEAEDDADFVRLMSAARAQLGNAVVDAVLNSAEAEP